MTRTDTKRNETTRSRVGGLDLTRGERLELNRRRRRLTQDEAAEALGTTPYIYRRWERDQHRAAPLVKVEPVADFEWCYVLRRRAGLTLRELGEMIGLSHKWIHRAERGEARDVSALVIWWEQSQEGDAR